MENVQPHQILVPLAIALMIGVLVLVWGDRPGLAAALRARFAPSADDDTPEEVFDEPPRQPPPPARFEVKHFAPAEQPAPAVLWQAGAVRAGTEPVRQQAEPAEPLPVRGQQNQLESVEPAKIEPLDEPAPVAISAQLSQTELIAVLAVQKNAAGGYRYSANQITGFIGGTAADVKKIIADIRTPPKVEPPPEPTQPERGKSLRRPAEGW